MDKKKIIWGILSLGIAVLTIKVIVSSSEEFSLRDLSKALTGANKFWLAGAVLAMFGYIWFEGRAVVQIVRTLGYTPSVSQGTLYGAADVFVSAITPSASGGQPASAFFMLRDGISFPACTSALLINLVMYTASTVVIGSVCLLTHLGLFAQLSILSKVLIIAGWIAMVGLCVLFYMLLRKSEILQHIMESILGWLDRMKLLRNIDKKRVRLQKKIQEYQECSDEIAGHGKMLRRIFCLNMMQRISQIGVTFMMFMALGKGFRISWKGFIVQALTALGSNSVPIPGGMGGADYLMLDGFRKILGHNAISVEMLCRSCSFYLCTITGAIIVIVGYFAGRHRRKFD